MLKYRNIKVEYDGYKFDSKKEAKYYQELVLRKKAKDISDFKVKPTFCIYSNDGRIMVNQGEPIEPIKNCFLLFRYTPDFIIIHEDFKLEIIDIKGVQTPVFKLKKRILEALGVRISIK